jgi:ubiquinone/menaquinone biosynthesis C-methylase UbiE
MCDVRCAMCDVNEKTRLRTTWELLSSRGRLLLDRIWSNTMDPARAYDLWSSTYDDQSDNLLLFLDEDIVAVLLEPVSLRQKTIVDVGCGTGRHWGKLLAGEPKQLVGYDVSAGMLTRLRDKYPLATVHRSHGFALAETPDGSCDLVISTLTLGYIASLDAAFSEWTRVLRAGGDMIVTDFHPEVAATGERSFRYQNRYIRIRHHAHALEALMQRAATHGLEVVRVEERLVDDSVRHFFESGGSPSRFESLKGKPLIYGAHFRKAGQKHRG